MYINKSSFNSTILIKYKYKNSLFTFLLKFFKIISKMSSLFQHNRESVISPFNKVYKIKNRNKSGHKKILLNVRSFKSPDMRSNSYRKKSTSKLFK